MSEGVEFDVASFIQKGGLRAHPVLEGYVTSAAIEAARINRNRRKRTLDEMVPTDNKRGKYQSCSERQQLLIAQAEFAMGRSTISTVGQEFGMSMSKQPKGKIGKSYTG